MSADRYLRFRGALYRRTTAPMFVLAKDMGKLVDPEKFKQLTKQVTKAMEAVQQNAGTAQKQYQTISKFRQDAMAQLDAYKSDPGKLQADQKAVADQLKPAAVRAFNQQGLQTVAELYQAVTKYYPNMLKQLNKLVSGSDQDRADAKAAQQQFGQRLQQDLGKFQELTLMAEGAGELNQQLNGVLNHFNSYQNRKEPDRQAIFKSYVKQLGGQQPNSAVAALANGLNVLNQQLPQLVQLYNGAVEQIKQKYQKHSPAPAQTKKPQQKFDPSKTIYQTQ
jgi:chromosome segregation ATPase